MSMRPEARLREFHDALGVEKFADLDEAGRRESLDLRRALIAEECAEVMEEFTKQKNGEGDRAAMAKELADLLVVVFGTADVLEIPLEAVFIAVMESNMTKVGPDAVYNEAGKVLKGPGYRPPDVEAVLNR